VDTKIEVLIAIEPGSAHETIVELIQHQNDMEIVGNILNPIELLLAVYETQAEVVVLTLPESGDMPGIGTHLLTEYPHLLILALSTDLKSGCLYRRGIVAEPLAKMSSEEGVLRAIRRVRTE
jgi:hypothetical protein